MNDTYYFAKNAGDTRFLHWIADRLSNVYGEGPDVDFVQVMREFANGFAELLAIKHDAAVLRCATTIEMGVEQLRSQLEDTERGRVIQLQIDTLLVAAKNIRRLKSS